MGHVRTQDSLPHAFLGESLITAEGVASSELQNTRCVSVAATVSTKDQEGVIVIPTAASGIGGKSKTSFEVKPLEHLCWRLQTTLANYRNMPFSRPLQKFSVINCANVPF